MPAPVQREAESVDTCRPARRSHALPSPSCRPRGGWPGTASAGSWPSCDEWRRPAQVPCRSGADVWTATRRVSIVSRI